MFIFLDAKMNIHLLSAEMNIHLLDAKMNVYLLSAKVQFSISIIYYFKVRKIQLRNIKMSACNR